MLIRILIATPVIVALALSGLIALVIATGGRGGPELTIVVRQDDAFAIHMIDVGTGATYRVDEGIQPSWSPDGRYLAYVTRDANNIRQLYLRDMKEGGTRHLFAYSGVQPVLWTPDGGGLTLTATPTGSATPQLIRYDVRTGETRLLTAFEDGMSSVWGYAWSADGAVLSVDEPRPYVRSSILNFIAPGRWRQIENAYQSAWGPGTQIAFVRSGEQGGANLYLLNVPGDDTPLGEPIALTQSAATASYPAWSPDGLDIAYVSRQGDDADDISHIRLLDLATGEHVRVSPDDGTSYNRARWSPDGRYLFLQITRFTPHPARVLDLHSGVVQDVRIRGAGWIYEAVWRP